LFCWGWNEVSSFLTPGKFHYSPLWKIPPTLTLMCSFANITSSLDRRGTGISCKPGSVQSVHESQVWVFELFFDSANAHRTSAWIHHTASVAFAKPATQAGTVVDMHRVAKQRRSLARGRNSKDFCVIPCRAYPAKQQKLKGIELEAPAGSFVAVMARAKKRIERKHRQVRKSILRKRIAVRCGEFVKINSHRGRIHQRRRTQPRHKTVDDGNWCTAANQRNC